MYIALLIILIYAKAQQDKLDSCKWESGKYSYDYSTLCQTAEPFHVLEGQDSEILLNMEYIFGIGKNIPNQCHGQSIAAIEVLDVLGSATDTCEIIGRQEQRTVQLVNTNAPDTGIKVTYAGGDPCVTQNIQDANLPRTFTFVLKCGIETNPVFILTNQFSMLETICHVEVESSSIYGCPTNYLNALNDLQQNHYSSIILFCLIFYFVAGYLYNFKYHDLAGVDALPHSEFWTEVPAYAIDGMDFTCKKINQVYYYMVNRIKNSTYELV